MEDEVLVDAQDHVLLDGQSGQAIAIGDAGRHRFFEEDMQTGFQQAAGDRGMGIGRGQHMGDVGHAGGDQLLDVAENIGDTPLPGAILGKGAVAVDDRRDLRFRNGGLQPLDMGGRNETGADQCSTVPSHDCPRVNASPRILTAWMYATFPNAAILTRDPAIGSGSNENARPLRPKTGKGGRLSLNRLP